MSEELQRNLEAKIKRLNNKARSLKYNKKITIATAAMQSLILMDTEGNLIISQIAEDSVLYADALLKELNYDDILLDELKKGDL